MVAEKETLIEGETKKMNWNLPSKRSSDNSLVGQRHLVLWGWWEKTLEQSGSGIENGGSLASNFDSDVNLLEVHKFTRDLGDVALRGGVEIVLADFLAELVGLNLQKLAQTKWKSAETCYTPRREGCSQWFRICNIGISR